MWWDCVPIPVGAFSEAKIRTFYGLHILVSDIIKQHLGQIPPGVNTLGPGINTPWNKYLEYIPPGNTYNVFFHETGQERRSRPENRTIRLEITLRIFC